MLHIKSQDGKGDPKIIQTDRNRILCISRNGHPTVKKYAYVDNGRNLYIIDIEYKYNKKDRF